MKVIVAHLRNDFSGSPRVLASVLKGWAEQKHEIELHCSTGEGFLSGIEGIRYRRFPYKLGSNRIETLIRFAISQVFLFFQILFSANRNTTVYINTLLPFAAGLAAKLRGAKVIYHLHEVAVSPASLHSFLLGMANRNADEAIYVSEYLKRIIPLDKAKLHVVHNSLDPEFTNNAPQLNPSEKFSCLMLCSLRSYKGVFEFHQLACRVPEVDFHLVVPENSEKINAYFADLVKPKNFILHSGQGDIRRFYAQAHLVLNLSRPAEWVESFGMTILEAMHFGLPSIAPPVGGPTELVLDGQNGFLIDPANIEELANRIRGLQQNRTHYNELAKSARRRTASFDYRRFLSKISKIVSLENTKQVDINSHSEVKNRKAV